MLQPVTSNNRIVHVTSCVHMLYNASRNLLGYNLNDNVLSVSCSVVLVSR